MSGVAAQLSPHGIKRKRHRWQRAASGRTVYAYVGDNPISRIDPYGLWSLTINAFGGFGGLVTFGQDPVTGQWFYGGGLGFGLGGGISFDYKGKRPGSKDGDCDHGTSVGTFGSLGGSVGPYQGSIDFSGGQDFSTSPSQGYSNPPAPNFTFGNGGGFEIGGAVGFEVVGH